MNRNECPNSCLFYVEFSFVASLRIPRGKKKLLQHSLFCSSHSFRNYNSTTMEDVNLFLLPKEIRDIIFNLVGARYLL